MIIQRLLAAPAAVLIVVVMAASVAAAPRNPPAEKAEVRAEDRAAVQTCLDLVAQALKRQTEAANKAQADGEKADKIDPAEWLRHAGERAAAEEASCIGVVSTPCQQTTEGRSNVGSADCMRRELAVWDERLNNSYKRWIDSCGEPKICAARRKFARAWLAAREARCALPWIEMQGTMAIPLTSSCMLDVTARHAIWLAGDEQ